MCRSCLFDPTDRLSLLLRTLPFLLSPDVLLCSRIIYSVHQRSPLNANMGRDNPLALTNFAVF